MHSTGSEPTSGLRRWEPGSDCRCGASSVFDSEFDLHIRGRNCDRAVEGSLALKTLNKDTALLVCDPFHPKGAFATMKQQHADALLVLEEQTLRKL